MTSPVASAAKADGPDIGASQEETVAVVAALDGQLVSRIRRMAAADSSALGRNPVTGLSAIRSA
jgi:hypothetical protein